jgi:hypothetical protein
MCSAETLLNDLVEAGLKAESDCLSFDLRETGDGLWVSIDVAKEIQRKLIEKGYEVRTEGSESWLYKNSEFSAYFDHEGDACAVMLVEG